MVVEIVEESPDRLAEYGEVSITFLVQSRLRLEPLSNGHGGLILSQEEVEPPYLKDYDACGLGPADWTERWDVSHWGVIAAFDGRRRVGGSVLARKTPGKWMLEDRDDLVVLQDMRVDPEYRRRGIGSRLFRRAVEWAQQRGCRQLKVETQNINAPACRFYAGQGCELGAIDRHAYSDFPEEVQLLLYLDLREP